MKYLRAKRQWKQDKPSVLKYLMVMNDEGDVVYCDDISRAVREYVDAFARWVHDEPKFFRRSR